MVPTLPAQCVLRREYIPSSGDIILNGQLAIMFMPVYTITL
jgi:hypothetical protein